MTEPVNDPSPVTPPVVTEPSSEPTPATVPAPTSTPTSTPTSPPSDRLDKLESVVDGLVTLVEKLLPADDQPTKKPWTHIGSRR